MPNEEFFSFDEALSELRLKAEELKRLVSEGDIRAFREGDTMKLRKGDVEALKSELSGGEVVDLGEPSEELVFEDDGLLDEAGMATEEISEMDTLLEDDIEDVGELEIADEEVASAAPAAAVSRTGAIAASKQDEEEGEGLGFRALAILTSLVLLLGIPMTISLSTGNVSDIAKAIAGIFGAEFPE